MRNLWGPYKFMLALLVYISFCSATSETKAEKDIEMEKNRIQIYSENPRYWQYKGKPVLLIGGSVEDNLFQISNLKAHLELLKSVGGNYVRSTMSWVDEGDVPPFKKVGDLYDLNQWNAEFWNRFRNFITWTHEMDIIVQIEVWATFNYYREPWAANPFNPKIIAITLQKRQRYPLLLIAILWQPETTFSGLYRKNVTRKLS